MTDQQPNIDEAGLRGIIAACHRTLAQRDAELQGALTQGGWWYRRAMAAEVALSALAEEVAAHTVLTTLGPTALNTALSDAQGVLKAAKNDGYTETNLEDFIRDRRQARAPQYLHLDPGDIEPEVFKLIQTAVVAAFSARRRHAEVTGAGVVNLRQPAEDIINNAYREVFHPDAPALDEATMRRQIGRAALHLMAVAHAVDIPVARAERDTLAEAMGQKMFKPR